MGINQKKMSGSQNMSSKAIFCYILAAIFIFLINIDPALSVSGTSYEFVLSKAIASHKKPVSSVVFNQDGSLIATGSTDGSVKLWETNSGKQIKAIIKHPHPITSMSFNPNGKLLAVGLESGVIALWDINYKERIRTINGHEGKIYCLRFNKDGSILASGSEDKTVKLWDMKSGNELKTFRDSTGAVYSLAFSPDEKSLASCSAGGSIRIWEISSGNSIQTLREASGKSVHSISYSPDSKTIASGSSDGSIRLWDVIAGTERISLVGQKGSINTDDCLSISPDGRLLASGSTDGTIMVWEIASGSIVNQQKPHQGSINTVVFTPDGKSLVTTGDDGIVKFWKIRVTESIKVKLNAPYDGWQRGILKLGAEVTGASDKVTFQFTFRRATEEPNSLDGSTWNNIVEDTESPYEVEWDTRQPFPDFAKNVQIRAIAERQPGISAIDIIKSIVSIDNQQPITNHDYDGLWHKSDFNINLSASDGDGIGVLAIYYRVNYGAKKDARREGQPKITDQGSNALEYWSIDKLENEGEHKILTDVKLDKTPPNFTDWSKEPQVLSRDYSGNLRISVSVIDDYSGLEGKIPQLDYHIGMDTVYNGYKNMAVLGDNVWYYDISEPSDGWKQYVGKPLYYKVKCEDFAGNFGESAEQQELIGSTKAPPSVNITTAFRNWENGKIKMEADALDSDGTIASVRFEYTLDGIKWTQIGTIQQTPYTIEWDTKPVVPEIAKNVMVQARTIDSDGLVAKYMSPAFGIDNQLPVTTQDYDGQWHKANFTVNLKAEDGNGGGIARIMYKINDSYERNVQSDGQPEIDELGENTIEYWSVDVAGNEETHKAIAGVKLDRFPPAIENWKVKKEDNILHVDVKVSDISSGLGDSPQFDYHAGSDTQFSGYKDMVRKDGDLWGYDLNLADLGDLAGKKLFCKVSARDVAGNLSIKTWDSDMTENTISTAVVESKSQEESPKTSTSNAIVQQENKTEPVADKGAETEIIPKSEVKGEKSSIIWLSQTPNTIKPGTKLSLSGKIEAKLTENETVSITLIAPGDVVYVSHTYTDSKGEFNFNVPLSSDGEWKVLAGWDGNSKYQSATSDTIKIRVISENSLTPIQTKKKAIDLFSTKSIIIGVLALYLLIINLFR
jgi:WD40 repeat protein